jgi:hypothetical protein
MKSAQVVFREEDRSFFVESLLQGLGVVMLKTKRGKYGISDEIYTSELELEKAYGGVDINFPGMILAKRAIRRGAKLRVVKIGHYTTISNPTTLDAVKAVLDETGPDFAVTTEGSPVELFDLTMKYPGADYNNIQVKITAASNGDASSFNLEINHLIDTYLNEKYENIVIPDNVTAVNSHYLDEVISKSRIMDVTYKDTAASTLTPPRPTNGTWSSINGTNGGTIVDADYVGDAGGTGLYFLSKFDDFEAFCALDNESSTFANAAATYALTRQDCIALLHIPNSNDAVSEVTSFRTSSTVDTRYVQWWCGGIKIRNPYVSSDLSSPMDISEIGDVLGVLCRSSAEFGPWFSYAGLQRGQIYDALGVVNNFAPGGTANLDELAQKQINAVVQVGSNIFCKGNFTAQKATSRKSFANVVKLLIYIRKSLKPTLERYLEQPNDFTNFRDLYSEVAPFFESLKGNDKRALVDYQWRGDQFANTDDALKINNRPDLDQGKYVVELWLKEIVSLQEFTLKLISAPSGVTFEDNLN